MRCLLSSLGEYHVIMHNVYRKKSIEDVQGQVVQIIVSLTSSLVGKMLTVLRSIMIANSQVFFLLKKM